MAAPNDLDAGGHGAPRYQVFSSLAAPNDHVGGGQSDCSTMAAARTTLLARWTPLRQQPCTKVDSSSTAAVHQDVVAGGRTNSSSMAAVRLDASNNSMLLQSLTTAPANCMTLRRGQKPNQFS